MRVCTQFVSPMQKTAPMQKVAFFIIVTNWLLSTDVSSSKAIVGKNRRPYGGSQTLTLNLVRSLRRIAALGELYFIAPCKTWQPMVRQKISPWKSICLRKSQKHFTDGARGDSLHLCLTHWVANTMQNSRMQADRSLFSFFAVVCVDSKMMSVKHVLCGLCLPCSKSVLNGHFLHLLQTIQTSSECKIGLNKFYDTDVTDVWM